VLAQEHTLIAPAEGHVTLHENAPATAAPLQTQALFVIVPPHALGVLT
jgi:hypothetical protein